MVTDGHHYRMGRVSHDVYRSPFSHGSTRPWLPGSADSAPLAGGEMDVTEEARLGERGRTDGRIAWVFVIVNSS
nr:hypothetical protein CFP56_25716 [Quercus suber]